MPIDLLYMLEGRLGEMEKDIKIKANFILQIFQILNISFDMFLKSSA